MNQLAGNNKALVLLTDFSDPAGWEAVQSAIKHPASIFKAYVKFVSDPEFKGMTIPQLLAIMQMGSEHTFIFVVDQNALSDPEHPILVLDLFEQPGRSFRVTPPEIWAVENHLSSTNMKFSEFADSVDAVGVFRGF